MRIVAAIAILLTGTGAAAASQTQFEAWTATCLDAKTGADCRAFTSGPASGAKDVTLTVFREAAKDASPRLILSIIGAERAPPRPRLALTVDGGPPVRLASGSDLASTTAVNGSAEIRLSEAATKRLLPFLRRGKVFQATITGEAGDQIVANIPIVGFGPAAAEIDRRQGRTDRQDALTAVIGGGTLAAITGLIRDVSRENVPEPLRKTLIDRDCPVWDKSESDPSFLAEQSFAADLGSGRTLWAIVCTSGSYNVEYALFVEDASKAANRYEPMLFAAFVESIGWTGVDTLSNVAYEPEKRQLTAFDKGRSAGDCGAVGVWEWVGAAFRMIEYRAKEECDGVGQKDKFPIVFRGER